MDEGNEDEFVSTEFEGEIPAPQEAINDEDQT